MSDLLKSIYIELYGPLESPGKMKNLEELATTLSTLAGRERPWTARYLVSLLNGNTGFKVTHDLEVALYALAGRLDNQPPLQALIVEIRAYSINGNVQAGSVILGVSRRCHRCQTLFVGRVPWQKYCAPECRDAIKKENASKGCAS